jgi:transcriptional regulator with XRE-family HTH domain
MKLTQKMPETISLKERFIARLRMVRAERGLSQENVAALLGISATGYANIERGETEPTLARIEEIAKVLKVEVGDLLPVPPSNAYYITANKGNVVGTNHGELHNYHETTHLARIELLERQMFEVLERLSGK